MSPFTATATRPAGGPRYARAMATVLVVDDDAVVRDVVRRYLERDGHRVVEAGHGDTVREACLAASPDLVVLDVMLPGTDGLELCSWIRARDETPVILLTALNEEPDRLVGLELGADDYVAKPFSPRELAARVNVVLRRSGGRTDRPPRLVAGTLVVDPASREAWRQGEALELTALEFELLRFFMAYPNVAFSREQLLASVWGHTAALDAGTSTVTVHIRRLREKIEEDPSSPRVLRTVWGVGYRFVP
jgi:DNA-binding response OmpR family regulator